jgi:hypothetical protein
MRKKKNKDCEYVPMTLRSLLRDDWSEYQLRSEFSLHLYKSTLPFHIRIQSKKSESISSLQLSNKKIDNYIYQ